MQLSLIHISWKDPMAVYQNEGYQIVQSLFAIGTGGWFGMGLCQGSPEKIPVVKNDFIFSAICEELGGIFAICLILVCTSFFLMIVTIALKIRNPFYKLIALCLLYTSAFGARAYAQNFTQEELITAIETAHIHNRKLYLTCLLYTSRCV